MNFRIATRFASYIIDLTEPDHSIFSAELHSHKQSNKLQKRK